MARVTSGFGAQTTCPESHCMARVDSLCQTAMCAHHCVEKCTKSLSEKRSQCALHAQQPARPFSFDAPSSFSSSSSNNTKTDDGVSFHEQTPAPIEFQSSFSPNQRAFATSTPAVHQFQPSEFVITSANADANSERAYDIERDFEKDGPTEPSEIRRWIADWFSFRDRSGRGMLTVWFHFGNAELVRVAIKELAKLIPKRLVGLKLTLPFFCQMTLGEEMFQFTSLENLVLNDHLDVVCDVCDRTAVLNTLWRLLAKRKLVIPQAVWDENRVPLPVPDLLSPLPAPLLARIFYFASCDPIPFTCCRHQAVTLENLLQVSNFSAMEKSQIKELCLSEPDMDCSSISKTFPNVRRLRFTNAWVKVPDDLNSLRYLETVDLADAHQLAGVPFWLFAQKKRIFIPPHLKAKYGHYYYPGAPKVSLTRPQLRELWKCGHIVAPEDSPFQLFSPWLFRRVLEMIWQLSSIIPRDVLPILARWMSRAEEEAI